MCVRAVNAEPLETKFLVVVLVHKVIKVLKAKLKERSYAVRTVEIGADSKLLPCRRDINSPVTLILDADWMMWLETIMFYHTG